MRHSISVTAYIGLDGTLIETFPNVFLTNNSFSLLYLIYTLKTVCWNKSLATSGGGGGGGGGGDEKSDTE